MRNTLKYIIVLMLAFIGASCKGEDSYTIEENVLTVNAEKFYSDSLSLYTLRFNNTVYPGMGAATTDILLIHDSWAFEVNDKIKFVKIEE